MLLASSGCVQRKVACRIANVALGTSHPISGRKARGALSASIQSLYKQAEAIEAIAAKVREQDEWINAFNDRGFFGRLKWLLVGR